MYGDHLLGSAVLSHFQCQLLHKWGLYLRVWSASRVYFLTNQPTLRCKMAFLWLVESRLKTNKLICTLSQSYMTSFSAVVAASMQETSRYVCKVYWRTLRSMNTMISKICIQNLCINAIPCEYIKHISIYDTKHSYSVNSSEYYIYI